MMTAGHARMVSTLYKKQYFLAMRTGWIIAFMAMVSIGQAQVWSLDSTELIVNQKIKEYIVLRDTGEGGTVDTMWVQQFDANGNQTIRRNWFAFEDLDSKLFTYNNEGQLMRSVWVTPQGDTIEQQHFTYADSLLKEKSTTNAAGNIMTEEYTYDEMGRVIAVNTLHDGELKQRTSTMFTDFGDIKRFSIADDKGKVSLYRKYLYDKNNDNRLTIVEENRNGVDTKRVYKYKDGKKVKDTRSDAKGNALYTLSFTYDKAGNITSEISDNAAGENYKRTFTYDKEGRLVTDKFSRDGKGVEQQFDYTYGSSDHPVTCRYYRKGAEGNVQELKYNDAGQLVKEDHYDQTGRTHTFSLTQTYNEMGLPMEKQTLVVPTGEKFRYRFVYIK